MSAGRSPRRANHRRGLAEIDAVALADKERHPNPQALGLDHLEERRRRPRPSAPVRPRPIAAPGDRRAHDHTATGAARAAAHLASCAPALPRHWLRPLSVARAPLPRRARWPRRRRAAARAAATRCVASVKLGFRGRGITRSASSWTFALGRLDREEREDGLPASDASAGAGHASARRLQRAGRRRGDGHRATWRRDDFTAGAARPRHRLDRRGRRLDPEPLHGLRCQRQRGEAALR